MTGAASVVTFTASAWVATFITPSIRMVCRAGNWISVNSAAWNPATSILTLYVPGSRFCTVYEPVSSVTTIRRTDVPTFWTVTADPGISAPDWSRTVPRIVPNVDCANATEPASAVVKKTVNVARLNTAFMMLLSFPTQVQIERVLLQQPATWSHPYNNSSWIVWKSDGIITVNSRYFNALNQLNQLI